mgnify:CR=1 FL=1
MLPLKKRLKKTIIVLLVIFLMLFVFRLIYGYQTVPETTENIALDIQLQSGMEEPSLNVRKNYASKKYKVIAGQNPARIDQKYEKIADIQTLSNQFDTEEKQIRQEVKDFDGLIQFENKNGNNGYRKLELIIGVPPENFDSIYNQLIKIGKVSAKQITKKDKTNEYKELNARKFSLEKIRESLIELKSKGGRIEEYMLLENRILDIEQQLQGLGVSLGNFDDENEFCTVKFSLSEGKISTISLLHRIKVALEWTVETYLMLMAALSFMTLFAYLSILTLEKIRTKI